MKTSSLPSGRPRRPLSSRGSALVMAVIFLFVGAVIVATAGRLVVDTQKRAKQQQTFVAEADNLARAGLVDALNWFRRQGLVAASDPAWPDGAFHPLEAPDDETLDESVGLVKEYRLSHLDPGQGVDEALRWGRYEVRRQLRDDPTVTPTVTVTPTPDPLAAHDVSHKRLEDMPPGTGRVWQLTSVGYVFLRRDPTKAFNEEPNRVVARSVLTTEIRKLNLTVPECACTVVDSGTNRFRLRQKGRLLAPNDASSPPVFPAACYILGSGPLLSEPASIQLQGSPPSANISSTFPDLTFEDVFSMPPEELRLLADVLVTDNASLEAQLSDGFDMQLVYVEGDAVFDGTPYLKGSGILVVEGNLLLQTTAAGKLHKFDGLLYVGGGADIRELSLISGSVIAQQGVTLGRTGATDEAWIEYNPALLADVEARIGQYREMGAPTRLFSGVPAE